MGRPTQTYYDDELLRKVKWLLRQSIALCPQGPKNDLALEHFILDLDVHSLKAQCLFDDLLRETCERRPRENGCRWDTIANSDQTDARQSLIDRTTQTLDRMDNEATMYRRGRQTEVERYGRIANLERHLVARRRTERRVNALETSVRSTSANANDELISFHQALGLRERGAGDNVQFSRQRAQLPNAPSLSRNSADSLLNIEELEDPLTSAERHLNRLRRLRRMAHMENLRGEASNSSSSDEIEFSFPLEHSLLSPGPDSPGATELPRPLSPVRNESLLAGPTVSFAPLFDGSSSNLRPIVAPPLANSRANTTLPTLASALRSPHTEPSTRYDPIPFRHIRALPSRTTSNLTNSRPTSLDPLQTQLDLSTIQRARSLISNSSHQPIVVRSASASLAPPSVPFPPPESNNFESAEPETEFQRATRDARMRQRLNLYRDRVPNPFHGHEDLDSAWQHLNEATNELRSTSTLLSNLLTDHITEPDLTELLDLNPVELEPSQELSLPEPVVADL